MAKTRPTSKPQLAPKSLSSASAWCYASPFPELRVRRLNDAPLDPNGRCVLYWMNAARRTQANFGLQRAAGWAAQLRKPLVVLEALRCDYPWASARLHAFVAQGMLDQQAHLQRQGVTYYPYLEPAVGAGRGLLSALASDAAIVVTDEFPCFFLPRMIAAAALRCPVAMEAIDSNGLLPLRAAPKVFLRAFDFRRHLQQELPKHWTTTPLTEPLELLEPSSPYEIPSAIQRRWSPATTAQLSSDIDDWQAFPIDTAVSPSCLVGGHQAATRRLRTFISRQLEAYGENRNHPDDDVSSGLSPYLHFGHLGVHEVFEAVVNHENWKPPKTTPRANGQREGWWEMSDTSQGFLDELITWRELGYNMCSRLSNYDQYESLPEWAQGTLSAHARDPREAIYELEQFEQAETHDPLWNAAQRQLVREGRMHNYLRMLWGKKVLAWSSSPREALSTLIHLNNKYALDGRNPNSYSGIFWTLGRYDRAWGPERPVFGTIRYMSSENTARKVRVREYLRRYA